MIRASLILLALLPAALANTRVIQPRVLTVEVQGDGSFIPTTMTISDGDRVIWSGLNTGDSVVRSAAIGVGVDPCGLTPSAFGAVTDEFTGPLLNGIPGLVARGPDEATNGPIIVTEPTACSCDPICPSFDGGTTKYCVGAAEVPGYVLDELWDYEWLSGLLLVWNWRDIEPTVDDGYVWTLVDHELEAAANSGKGVRLALRAGQDGFPQGWPFDDEGVTKVVTEDTNNGEFPNNCGVDTFMASPNDEAFRTVWFDFITDVCGHIKEDPAHYQKVTEIWLSGLNIQSDEMKMPKSCSRNQGTETDPTGVILDTINGDACKCNTERFAEAGYTPAELYEFFSLQTQTILDACGDHMTVRISLIDDGWPRIEGINATSGKLNFLGDTAFDTNGVTRLCADCTAADDGDIPSGSEQTDQIIEDCTTNHPENCIVYHNGGGLLGQEDGAVNNCSWGQAPAPADGLVSYPHFNGLIYPHGAVNNEQKCPNHRATNVGIFQGLLSGHQSNNAANGDIADPVGAESYFATTLVNGDFVTAEIYGSLAWWIENDPLIGPDGVMDPTRLDPPKSDGIFPYSLTPNQWNNEFSRRRRLYPNPPPSTWDKTFTVAATHDYYNARTCSQGTGKHARIVVQ